MDEIKLAYLINGKRARELEVRKNRDKPKAGKEWAEFLIRAHFDGLIKILGFTEQDPKDLLARCQEFHETRLATPEEKEKLKGE